MTGQTALFLFLLSMLRASTVQLSDVTEDTSDVTKQLTDVTVTCDAGTFIGFRDDVQINGNNVTLSKFYGIPFAEPPVGDLRFRKPVSKAALTEPYKAQKFGPKCLQLYMMFPPSMEHSSDSEDCLYLNIFKPEVDTENEALPVMVWIYGGGFVLGYADPYIGDALAANGPVIVVTFNYRLSAWGFLSTGDDNAPGNYGLWDQHEAIRWVHNYIAAFGGDPTRVTVFGESAGGASTIYQGLYPGNQGLFQRLIGQSGSPAASWASVKDPVKDAKKIGEMVGCVTDDMAELISCLRDAPVEKLNASVNDIEKWGIRLPFPFIPVVDKDFVLFHPSDSLDANHEPSAHIRDAFASYDLIIGLNSGEGASNVNPMLGVTTSADNFLPNRTEFEEILVPALVNLAYGTDAPAVIKDLIVAEYTDASDPENPDNIRENFCEMQKDAFFLSPTFPVIAAHASSVTTPRSYQYLLSALPHKSLFPRPAWYDKPLHADDLLFMFGNMMDFEIPGMIEMREFQDWEKVAADNIMTLWTNFAKTGSPNKPRDIGVDWLPYTPTRHRYLEIYNDVTASKVKERLGEKRAVLWDTILPAIAKLGKCDKDDLTGTCSKDGCDP